MRRLIFILGLVIGWSILLAKHDSNRWGRMVAEAQVCCINEGEYYPHYECVGNECLPVESCGIDDCSFCSDQGCDPNAEIDCINGGGTWDSTTCTCYPPEECDPCTLPGCMKNI
jgi:hypothetical protein